MLFTVFNLMCMFHKTYIPEGFFVVTCIGCVEAMANP